MPHYLRLSVTAAAILMFALVTSAAAFSFEYYYFETDKQVYEVGETIHMTAKLTADFDESGWCYVSFSVVLNDTNTFFEGYYLDPSPTPQFPSAAFLITPEDVRPGERGLTGAAVFDFDFYDPRYSQAASESVTINVTRGHLKTVPLTSLSAQTGSNLSLSFRVVSIHNDLVVSKDSVTVATVSNASGIVYQSQALTDSEGVASFLWNTSGVLPGSYNLTIEGLGTDAFLPFSQSFTIEITPLIARVEPVSAPQWSYGMGLNGEHENITLQMMHQDSNGVAVQGGYVTWELSNLSGAFVEIEPGLYTADVPVCLTPGNYSLVVTATHIMYQNASVTLPLEVIPRPLNVSWEVLNETPTAGETVFFTVHVVDNESLTGVSASNVSIRFQMKSGLTLQFEGTANSMGWLSGSVVLPSGESGEVQVSIVVAPPSLFADEIINTSLVVWQQPILLAKIQTEPILGYETNITCNLTTALGQPIPGIMVTVYNESLALGSAQTDIHGYAVLVFTPTTVQKEINLFIRTDRNESLYLLPVTQVLQVEVAIPVSVRSVVHPVGKRGSNITVEIESQCQWLPNSTVPFSISNPVLGTYNQSLTINGITLFQIYLNAATSPGLYPMGIQLLNSTMVVVESQEIVIEVRGEIRSVAVDCFGFYDDTITINLTIEDDLGNHLYQVDLEAVVGNETYYCENVNSSSPIILPLRNVTPGRHIMQLCIDAPYYYPIAVSTELFVWVRVTMTFQVSKSNVNQLDENASVMISDQQTTSRISDGSINLPPPILLSPTTSTIPPTARSTSRTNCPRFSSGTKMCSTDCAKARTSLSGKGHKVLKRSDRTLPSHRDTASSTALAVLPNDMTPQVALVGPEITGLGKKWRFRRTFSCSRRTR